MLLIETCVAGTRCAYNTVVILLAMSSCSWEDQTACYLLCVQLMSACYTPLCLLHTAACVPGDGLNSHAQKLGTREAILKQLYEGHHALGCPHVGPLSRLTDWVVAECDATQAGQDGGGVGCCHILVAHGQKDFRALIMGGERRMARMWPHHAWASMHATALSLCHALAASLSKAALVMHINL